MVTPGPFLDGFGVGRPHAEESLEDVRLILRADAQAVVSNGDAHHAVAHIGAHLHAPLGGRYT